MFLADEAARRRARGRAADAARIRHRPADRPVGRAGQQDRADAQRRRRLSRHAGGDRCGREKRRAVQLHLPRRCGRDALHRGADPRPSPRRAGEGADRRRRRRLFPLGHLPAPARGRRAGRPVPAFLRAVEDAVPQPAQPSQADGGGRPHRFHRRHQYRPREPAGHQSGASGARHAFPPRGPGRRAAHRGLRRRLAVRDR